MSDNAAIATRRHPQIQAKQAIWKLISDSYAGGDVYRRGDHLRKYPKESSVGHDARKDRAVYFNHVQPLADLLAGFIFSTPPTRVIPEHLKFMEEKTSKRKNLDSFMQTLAIQTLLRTCGVLVDSPNDAGEYATEADRLAAKKNPYCVIYMPERIRDFTCDEDGKLEWILLDNSKIDQSDATQPPVLKCIYRLWTKTEIVDYEIHRRENQETTVSEILRKPHALGVVPFIFVNWRDVDEDYICETPFEDIALIDRQIFNCLSYLDEMLAAGTFRMLFFPVIGKDDVPKSVVENGVGGSQVITYPATASHPPEFKGHTLEDVAPFVSAMEMYIKEIFSKLGLDKDQERTYVQSGVAKDYEFQKCEALLRLGAEQLEATEKQIFDLAGKWLQKPGKAEIAYSREFKADEIDTQMTRLLQLSLQPYESLKRASLKKLAKLVLNDIPKEEMDQILKEIETKKQTTPEVKDMKTKEAEARSTPDAA